MPLRVSMEAVWPICTSLACVSAIFSSAFSRDGFGDAREVGAGRDLLADLDRHELQNAGDAGAHVELVDLPLLQPHDRPRLIDLGLLHGEPRLHRLGVAGELLARRSRTRAASCSASSFDCFSASVDTSSLAAAAR